MMGGGAVTALLGGTFSGEGQSKKHPVCFNKVQMVAPRNKLLSEKNQFILDIWKYGKMSLPKYTWKADMKILKTKLCVKYGGGQV